MSDCPGADGLVCVDGWLYSQMSGRMMIFPANRKCPVCNKEAPGGEDSGVAPRSKML
jgi:hypothetical protein